MAAEPAAAYSTGEADGGHARDDGGVLDRLDGLLDEVVARSIDELDEPGLRAELGVLERATRRLSARQARLAAALSSRRSRSARVAAREAGRNDEVAGARAVRQVARELADELGWAPGETRRKVTVGRELDASEQAGRAFDAGRLTARHAAVLADTLRWIVDPRVRADCEARLLGLAASLDAVGFGRACRRLLAEVDVQAADRAAARRRQRRAGSVWQTEDGMTGVSGLLSGVDAELFTTAFHAFRRFDAPDESRSPQQAGADALVAMARAALDAGTAARQHGVRPHVTVHIDAGIPDGQPGRCEGVWTGPLPASEVRRILEDCGVGRLLVDAAGVALEASEQVRTVPVGLYREVEARDGGCAGDGCDVPPAWCEVMHLDTPFRFGGKLTASTAALGCDEHHDAHDRRGWIVTWIDDAPVIHHPDRPPDPDKVRAHRRLRRLAHRRPMLPPPAASGDRDTAETADERLSSGPIRPGSTTDPPRASQQPRLDGLPPPDG